MSILKLTWRSIRSFFGRYMALLLIVALSAGFFAGLKITKDAMANTCEDYLTGRHFYDFRVFSTLGFTTDDVDSLRELSSVAKAEGSKSVDAMMEYDGECLPFKLFSIPEAVNLPTLTAGRMPASETECLADDRKFDESDIGSIISVSDENGDDIIGQLNRRSFTIVGLVNSPLYIGNDRGTTGIGSGALHGFLYLPADSFTGEVYTEINLTLKETEKIYSDKYDALIDENEVIIKEHCKDIATQRYNDILTEYGVSAEYAEQIGIFAPEIYVLSRNENAGYVSFENDTSIISGIANIFPLFFILIAMLVCITTMTRMVDEERTQNGVLKALGFRDISIIAKYLLYAGSATVLGWGVGFFFGTWGLPKVFWYAFSSLYDFASLKYLFSPFWAVMTLGVSVAGILGSTLISCQKELRATPAILIRPHAAKTGKRILLELITPIWKRLTFLQKITLRNMFRYKRRLIMMLVGISCCAGLVVTAFGVRDSMIHIGTTQFENIQKYDMEIAFSEGDETAVSDGLNEISGIESSLACAVSRVDLRGSEIKTTVNLYSFQNAKPLSDFWDFHTEKEPLSFPAYGETMINIRAAEKLSVSVGDTLEIQNSDMQTLTVTVSGIFDNYIDSFAIISKDTYESALGEWNTNTMLLLVSGETQAIAEDLTAIPEVTSVVQLSDTQKTVDSALSCLNYIIWIVVLFAGALAFIVIFNLTNINLAERSREIATVEVLGFYPNETESYVLRENLILSVLASLIGLPLGTLFHQVVMSMIVIDFLAFDIHVTTISYALSLVLTVLFAVLVNLFMKRQIGKIQMAESLKAVE